MELLFVTNLPSPYRVDFFNELGKYCELTVLYERQSASDRDKSWKNTGSRAFREIYADVKAVGADRSRGSGIKNIVKKREFDHLIISGYASPSVMRAITYCKRHGIPYCLEYDGGFNKKDSFLKGILKKFLLRDAKLHFTTCEEHKKYLLSIGIAEKKIVKYPFTSVSASSILEDLPSDAKKKEIREALGMNEDKIVLSIGQFIHRKGFDVLLRAAENIDKHVGIYIVGGEPTEEYLQMQAELKLGNVHFVGFRTKAELEKYYLAADVFVLPTREDIWGLVINEAMANGLPVITTDRCIAGLELVLDGENGYIVPAEDVEELANKINIITKDIYTARKMGQASLEKIKKYTFENMAESHLQIIK